MNEDFFITLKCQNTLHLAITMSEKGIELFFSKLDKGTKISCLNTWL